MKRLKDLTRDELLAEGFNIESLIEIECAFQGVVIPVEPEYLTIPEATTPDKTFYEVNSQLFTSAKDAEIFINSAYRKDWQSECPEPLKNNSYNSSINQVLYYSPDVYARNKQTIELRKTNKEKNENLTSDYKKICKPYNELRDEIFEEIQAHKDVVGRESCQIKIFQSYMDLAEGDKSVATKFYAKAYGDVPQYLTDHFGLNDPQEAPLTAEELEGRGQTLSAKEMMDATPKDEEGNPLTATEILLRASDYSAIEKRAIDHMAGPSEAEKDAFKLSESEKGEKVKTFHQTLDEGVDDSSSRPC